MVNAIQGLATLALAQRQFTDAHAHLVKALTIQIEIDNRLGAAGTHGYLARVALAAKQPVRAVVFASTTWRMLVEVDSRFGQCLAFQELMRALAALDENAGAIAALLWAWRLAREIDDPMVEQLERNLEQTMPGLDLANLPPEIWDEATGLLESAADRARQTLAEAHVDPYGPLE